jgi:hypothetical protein
MILYHQSAPEELVKKSDTHTQNGKQVHPMSERSYKGPNYPTEAHGTIPAFHSYEEEAEFWDTHDFTDFKAETETAKVKATTGLSANVQVRFEPDTDHELEIIARERGMKKATLIRTWVLDRLRQERNRHAS